MARSELPEAILAYLRELGQADAPATSSSISRQVKAPWSTVLRHLNVLVAEGSVVREGAGPTTRYRFRKPVVHDVSVVEHTSAQDTARASVALTLSEAASELRSQLQAPLGSRLPVTYKREFVDDYRPNESFLLPLSLAAQLYAEGRSKDNQPAGTYARKVLEQLLIDLSWYSSRLEGNQKSWLDTKELFERGRSDTDDLDATMLLNHKDAIEFMVDAVPTMGITTAVVRNLQSLLMDGLLANEASLGAIRKTVVNITDTVYVPTQVPQLLEEMLEQIVEKARNIRNPVEAAFFLWVNLAYLQPFEDGNKRTSRLAANLPLMLSNCAPLSFLEVEQSDYALAILGIYEKQDVTLAAELFAWTYRRSIAKYQVVLESMGTQSSFRAKHRQQLTDVMQQVVYYDQELSKALDALALPASEREEFTKLAQDELRRLEPYNCARYRLPIGKTEAWIKQGRPRI